jgi:formate dehydrogenase subunit gamma
MSEMVRKTNRGEIVNHWVLAISCILLIVTGYGFLFRLEQMYAFFGGAMAMKLVHNWAGVVFTISLLATLFSYLGEALTFDADDWAWIKVAGGYLSRKPMKSPPMGKLNTGQKLLYLCIVAAGTAVIATGFLIWQFPVNRSVLLVSHFVHNAAFIFFVMAVPTHAYLGTLANPGTFRIMVYGTVPVEFARRKYPKWMKEIGKR